MSSTKSQYLPDSGKTVCFDIDYQYYTQYHDQLNSKMLYLEEEIIAVTQNGLNLYYTDTGHGMDMINRQFVLFCVIIYKYMSKIRILHKV